MRQEVAAQIRARMKALGGEIPSARVMDLLSAYQEALKELVGEVHTLRSQLFKLETEIQHHGMNSIKYRRILRAAGISEVEEKEEEKDNDPSDHATPCC